MTETIIINKRVQSIDLLRGLVMTTMALDHSRDFIHYGNSINQDPLDFATTNPILFMTRWITHFCAPVFVFLSGTSIFLYSSKGKTKKQVAFFLFTRGFFLMFAQIFIMAPLWDASLSLINLQVIWAIGLCMVILSVLQFLSCTGITLQCVGINADMALHFFTMLLIWLYSRFYFSNF